MGVISDAPVVWNVLRGVICVYKPAGLSAYDVRKTLVGNIASDLCDLKCRPPVNHVFIQDEPGKKLEIYTAPSYADNTLVAGPRYQPKDVRCAWASYLGRNTSGVFVVGLNDGIVTARHLHINRPTRVYHVKGRLGEATDTFFNTGKVIEKATFKHVKQSIIDGLLASMQAAHQKQMFEHSGVDLQSEAAYELAIQGPIRPFNGKIPLLYGIKCICFQPPEFTVEVQCINEYESYLMTLIHEIGLQLRTVATCTGIRCIQYSHFTLQHSLLRKHWRLQYILDNLTACSKIIWQKGHMTKQSSPVLMKDESVGDNEIMLEKQDSDLPKQTNKM